MIELFSIKKLSALFYVKAVTSFVVKHWLWQAE
jgi:hypothetical protein